MVWGSNCCLLQMMWSCWHHQSVTFSTHWIGLQPSVKWLGWGSAPLNMSPWFSARTCVLSTSSREWILTPSEGVQVSWGLVHEWGAYGMEIGQRGHSSRSTSQSSFQPSPIVMKDGSWPKEWHCWYKQMTLLIQAAEMGFLRRVAGISLRYKVRGSITH